MDTLIEVISNYSHYNYDYSNYDGIDYDYDYDYNSTSLDARRKKPEIEFRVNADNECRVLPSNCNPEKFNFVDCTNDNKYVWQNKELVHTAGCHDISNLFEPIKRTSANLSRPKTNNGGGDRSCASVDDRLKIEK